MRDASLLCRRLFVREPLLLQPCRDAAQGSRAPAPSIAMSDRLVSLIERANRFRVEGNYARAESILVRAMAIASETHGDRSLELALIANGLGVVLKSWG